MDIQGTPRKLTAIFCADVAGFSRLMGADEAGTHRLLREHREVMDGRIARHGGRIANTAGDSVLAEFTSVANALTAALEIQDELKTRNAEFAADRRLAFRIGLHLGDVIVDGDNLYGDGVNIAARLQALADPGGIVVSGNVFDDVHKRMTVPFRPMGPQRVKNIAEPLRAYRVGSDGVAAVRSRPGMLAWAGAAALALAVMAAAVWVWVGPHRSDLAASSPPPTAATPDTGPRVTPPHAVSTRPVIAVLPFANLSGDPAQDYFSDGLTEDIIAALGRFSSLAVIGRNAVFAHKGKPVDAAALARELGAQYIVEGAVRRSADLVRVTLQLTDGMQRTVLWSDRYESQEKNIFTLQDEVTRRIAGSVAVRLSRIEQERALAKPTENLEAYDYMLKGRSALARQTRASNFEARMAFEKAVKLDPSYAAAHVGIGWTEIFAVFFGWSEAPGQSLDRAAELARRGISLAPEEPDGHALLGTVYSLRRQPELAVGELETALRINPSDAFALARYGSVLLWASRPEDAIPALEAALRFDPASASEAFTNLGFGLYLTGRYADAIQAFERSLQRDAENPFGFIGLAICYGRLGRAEEAARAVGDIRRRIPFFDTDQFGRLLPNTKHREEIWEGLRAAGLS